MPGSRDDRSDRQHGPNSTDGGRGTRRADGGRGPGQGGGAGGRSGGGGAGSRGGGYAGVGNASSGGNVGGGGNVNSGHGGGGQYSAGTGGGQYAGGQQMGHAPQAATGGSFVTGPVTTAYVKFCAAVYAAIGVGIGLLLFVLDAVGMSPVIVEWEGYSSVRDRTVEQSEALPLFSGEFLYPLLVILAVGVSVAVAVYVARDRTLTDKAAATATAAGTGVGSLVMLVTGGFLGFQKLRFVELVKSYSDDQAISNAYTIEPLNLVVNAVVVAVFAAAISVAVVYSLRNLAPDR